MKARLSMSEIVFLKFYAKNVLEDKTSNDMDRRKAFHIFNELDQLPAEFEYEIQPVKTRVLVTNGICE